MRSKFGLAKLVQRNYFASNSEILLENLAQKSQIVAQTSIESIEQRLRILKHRGKFCPLQISPPQHEVGGGMLSVKSRPGTVPADTVQLMTHANL